MKLYLRDQTQFKDKKEFNFLHLIETKNLFKEILKQEKFSYENYIKESTSKNNDNFDIEKNSIIHEDCINYLKKLSNKYPEGIFDLFFADPPYNLENHNHP